MTTNWDEIPSIDNLKMDWDYEPESPHGKRSTIRLSEKQLLRMLGEESIPVRIVPLVPVKIVSKRFNEKGYLLDVSVDGLAIFIEAELTIETPVKVGFFLGKRKIISRGIVKNVAAQGEQYRVGIKFVKLEEESMSFINSLHSSAMCNT